MIRAEVAPSITQFGDDDKTGYDDVVSIENTFRNSSFTYIERRCAVPSANIQLSTSILEIQAKIILKHCSIYLVKVLHLEQENMSKAYRPNLLSDNKAMKAGIYDNKGLL
jgi:hypothetical protein